MGLLKRMLGRAAEDSPDVRSLNACVVHAGGLLGVVGESYRQDALREVAARTTDAAAFSDELVDYAAEVAAKEPHRRWFMAVLVREPDNEHDPLAVAVHAAGGRRLGYLTRENARAYGQVFESLEKRGYEAAVCPAMLSTATLTCSLRSRWTVTTPYSAVLWGRSTCARASCSSHISQSGPTCVEGASARRSWSAWRRCGTHAQRFGWLWRRCTTRAHGHRSPAMTLRAVFASTSASAPACSRSRSSSRQSVPAALAYQASSS